MKLIAFLFLLLPVHSYSQGLSPDEKDFTIPEFSQCGLITRWASNKISPNCLTISKNVVFDEDLSISRRLGSAIYNTTPCTDSKYIKGLWNFNARDGQRFIVINSSSSFFYAKTDGTCNQITGLNGFNEVSNFECVQGLGELYCTNGIDTPFKWDGASTTTIPSMPKGTKIGTFRNRIVVSGVPGQLTRILLSGDGNGSDWTLKIPGQSTSPSSIDISGLDDGEPVTALLGTYQNAFYIGRDRDLWGLYGNDRRDFTLRQISNQIGVLDSRSVQEKDNCKIWLSRRGMEKMCGTTIERISDVIRPTIDTIISASGNSRTKTYDTEADWETGLYNPHLSNQGPLSTTINPGSVVPSTWGVIIDLGLDWSSATLVNVSTTQSPGYLQTLNTTGYVLFDDFSYSNYSPKWTKTQSGALCSGSDSIVNGVLQSRHFNDGQSGNCITQFVSTYTKTTIYPEYHFKVDTYNALNIFGSINKYFQFMSIGESPFINGYGLKLVSDPSATVFLYLQKYNNGVTTNLTSTQCTGRNIIFNANFELTRSTAGLITVTATGNNLPSNTAWSCPTISATDADFNNSDHVILYSDQIQSNLDGAAGYDSDWDNIFISTGSYATTGTWTKIHDTTFDSPIGGPFVFDDIVPTGSTVTYSIAESADGLSFGSFIQIPTDGQISQVPFNKRYWEEKIELQNTYNTSDSTQTPSIDFTSLEATTSGYYIADCVNTTGITSFGNFRPSSIIFGNNNVIGYAVNSGNSCNQVTRATATWSTQLANGPINASTNTFLGIRIYEEPTSSTNTIRLDAMTIEWNEGNARPSVASVVHKDRYIMYYTTGTLVDSFNNQAIVYDINEKWTQFDNVFGASAILYENRPYIGDSRSTGQLIQQNIGIDDSGDPFEFHIKTADFDYGNAIEKKELKRVYLTLKSETVPGQNINLTLNYYINGSTTPYSLSSVGLSEAVEPGYFVAKFPAINSQPTTFNWLSYELQYSGVQGPISLYSIRTIYRPIRWE